MCGHFQKEDSHSLDHIDLTCTKESVPKIHMEPTCTEYTQNSVDHEGMNHDDVTLT